MFLIGKVCNKCGIFKGESEFSLVKRVFTETKVRTNVKNVVRFDFESIGHRYSLVKKITKTESRVKKTELVHNNRCRFCCQMMNIVSTAFQRKGYKKESKTYDILGCSHEFLVSYIESQFKPWMTWNNRGRYNGTRDFGWDVDHIIPLSSVESGEDLIRLCHYTNLRPLCSYENRVIKRDKIDFNLINQSPTIPEIEELMGKRHLNVGDDSMDIVHEVYKKYGKFVDPPPEPDLDTKPVDGGSIDLNRFSEWWRGKDKKVNRN